MSPRRLVGLLVIGFVAAAPGGGMSAGAASDDPVDYALPGPWGVEVVHMRVPLPQPQYRTVGPALTLRLTLPAAPAAGVGANGSAPCAGPRPLLYWINGFQGRAAWYARIAHHAASWGYAVAAYDLPVVPPPIADEAALWPAVRAALAAAARAPGGPLAGRLDLARCVAAGHSRGGKVAALLLAGGPPAVRAAFLVDPVDERRPSAAAALARCGAPVGIAAAGVGGACNPARSNYSAFFAAAGPGSSLGVAPRVGHAQFLDAGAALNWLGDRLCGRGAASREQAAELAAVPMLLWFWRQLGGEGGGGGGGSPLPAFQRWLERQQACGALVWQEKGGAPVVAHAVAAAPELAASR